MDAALHGQRGFGRLALVAAPPPVALGLSLVGPALDLLGRVQHVLALETPALLACGLASLILVTGLAHRLSSTRLAAALAIAASVLLRLAGAPEAPALAMLAVLALGIGGAGWAAPEDSATSLFGGVAMAVYEYECQACGRRFEVKAPMSEHDRFKLQPPRCPECGRTDTRQLISNFACKTPAG